MRLTNFRWKLLGVLVGGLFVWSLLSSKGSSSDISVQYDFPRSVCNDSEDNIYVNHFYLHNNPNNRNHSYSLRALNPFSIQNPGLCFEEHSLDFLVLINTEPSHFLRRIVIRKTWANVNLQEYKRLGNFRILFLMGHGTSKKIQKAIEKEAKQHGDILQGRFSEVPNNLPQKALMGLRWTAEYCLKAKMIIRIEDTILLNMFEIMREYKPKYSCTQNFMMCKFIKERIKFMDYENLKKMKLTPTITHCVGKTVIMTRDMLISLYHAAPHMTPYWSDDMYIYGMLPAQIPHKTLKPLKLFEGNSDRAIDCYETNLNNCGLVAMDTQTRSHHNILWSHIKRYSV
ncbi:lactosylceramide 1,3-N-acetyl-beta-D-glucosaminyltransferase B-like [Ostrea edulis]|uniref:lactosylceramide 1,3-N-acetyl-beta-D-glucosaminyltransferase B-like n=1 Tax=Ostrea edulis TaxID=37623 RepID=UPI0020953BE0|nr:lactosylceramide 1,3-N-acetyl-beta-D-glucosaminyltransferase B-like [Ostrea edulis]